MVKNFYVYADGSNERGTGHLRRAQTLWQKLNSNHNVIPLHENDFQRKFYLDNSLESQNIYEFDSYLDATLIIDTKTTIPKKLLAISKNQKKIYIDHYHEIINKDDLLVFPSFYLNDAMQEILNNESIKINYGKQFMLLRNEFFNSKKNKEINDSFITISFGGTDPNNLTQKTLENIDFGSEKIICIKGKQNKNKIKIPDHLISTVKIIENTDDMANIFRSSKFVITALGTTVQELFFLKKPFGLICNYREDENDIGSIKKELSKEGLKGFLNFCFYYKELPRKFKLEIDKFEPSNISDSHENEFGIFWKNLL